jgi:hypothetical protein
VLFLASAISETSALTRDLATSAGRAAAALADTMIDPAAQRAVGDLLVALQTQDRVEQRLARLEAYARELSGATPDDAVLARALHLDELVIAFRRHRGETVDVARAMDEDELF